MTRKNSFCGTDNYVKFESLEKAMDKELLKKIKLKVAKKRLLTKAEFIESIQLHNIPIVFHVIHHNDLENIPKEQILDQLNSLNKDFRNQNIDNVLFDTYSHEKYLATDSKIQFTIAEMDPNGNSTDGITRKCTNREFFEKLCNPSMKYPYNSNQLNQHHLEVKMLGIQRNI